jgi:acetyl-CoA carboxylase biotin carboxyl carrier protein
VSGTQPADARDRDADAPDTSEGRAADHAAIERLTDELLPALIAKLGATGLGELEVRQGGWKVRLRRPAGNATPTATPARERKGGDRSTGERSERTPDRTSERSPRTLHRPLEAKTARTESRAVATSPAVGIFRSRADLTAGTRVRAGDRLGAVDMLGVAQEVVAPVDGILGASLVESGDAVEYGQEILVIQLAPGPGSTNGTGPDPGRGTA